MRSVRWIALLWAVLAFDAAAQGVGNVIIAVGEVVAQRGGREVPLATGASLQPGDVVRTGEASTAQLRFVDSSIVAMRSKSEFRIDEFRFTGADDSAARGFYSLLRGGLRTLTGFIGSARRENYRVRTSVATLGIRGTTYALVHCERDCVDDDGSPAPDGTYGVVFDGRVGVANPAGEAEFGAEEAFYVADLRTPPQALVGRPGFLRDRLEARARRQEMRERMEARAQALAALRQQVARVAEARLGFGDARPVAQLGTTAAPIVVIGDLTDPSGNVALIGPGLGAGIGFSSALGPATLVDGGRGTVISLDPDRRVLERFIFNGGLQSGSRNGAFVTEGGSLDGDGGAVFGRWGPGATVSVGGVTGAPSTGVHFFFGNLTPESLLRSVPATATAVRYDYATGTRPTDERGTTGQFLDGHFIVNLVQRLITGDLSYRVDNVTYVLTLSPSPIVAGAGWIGFRSDQRNAGRAFCPQCGAPGVPIEAYSISGLFLGSRAQGLGVTFATDDSRFGRTAGMGLFRCVSGGCR